MGRKMSMMEFIEMKSRFEQEDSCVITLEEFTEIRRNGSPEELSDAVARMEAAGGYDNLE
jgi:hypothetical protein